jgi:hypothetical protein
MSIDEWKYRRGSALKMRCLRAKSETALRLPLTG